METLSQYWAIIVQYTMEGITYVGHVWEWVIAHPGEASVVAVGGAIALFILSRIFRLLGGMFGKKSGSSQDISGSNVLERLHNSTAECNQKLDATLGKFEVVDQSVKLLDSKLVGLSNICSSFGAVDFSQVTGEVRKCFDALIKDTEGRMNGVHKRLADMEHALLSKNPPGVDLSPLTSAIAQARSESAMEFQRINARLQGIEGSMASSIALGAQSQQNGQAHSARTTTTPSSNGTAGGHPWDADLKIVRDPSKSIPDRSEALRNMMPYRTDPVLHKAVMDIAGVESNFRFRSMLTNFPMAQAAS